MELKTKFNIGQRVWCPELSHHGNGNSISIDLASGIITSISVEKDGKINYFFEEWCTDYYEDKIIAYENTVALTDRLIELDNQIRKEKENKNE